MHNTKVRYAVVGAGNIAQVAVLPAFAHAEENSELVALISSDANKRDELCEKYNLQLAGDYTQLEKVFEKGKIDAVYIATPNTLHREHTLRAAARGVHVLCEKPLAPTVAACDAMARACSKNGVKLMVAYRLHFEEATLTALNLIHQGKIGEVRVFDSVFSHVVRPGDIRLRPETGGGACLDLGVYCINAARHVFHEEPIWVSAVTHEKDGVDDTTTAVMRFPNGGVAQFTVSNSLASTSSYRVLGTQGDLRLEPAYEYAEGLEQYLTTNEKTRHTSFASRDQFAPQLIHFSDAILNGTEPRPSAAEGLADIRVVEAILESAKLGRPVELPLRKPRYQPSQDQEMRKPATKKQEPISAPSPSLK
ncbi:MAG: Gfo/Idh/MocA family oxidoreductase [Polyangiaceae bacterium]|nr:Gfo/Idh/MocA family oxidoreductase [Polyangiaceae bacterium]